MDTLKNTTNQNTSDESRALLRFAVIDKKLNSSTDSFELCWIRFSPEKVDEKALLRCLNEVLVDDCFQKSDFFMGTMDFAWNNQWLAQGFRWWAEKQFLPGVTDNLAHTIKEALSLKSGSDQFDSVEVASGKGFLFNKSFAGKEEVLEYSQYKLFHPLVEKMVVHDLNKLDSPGELLGFPRVKFQASAESKLETVDLNIGDKELETLSRNRLLALSLAEMQEIKKYYQSDKVKKLRESRELPVKPTDVELEVFAQTWSEHCKHKIFAADITFEGKKINSLYKTYIKGATNKLRKKRPDLLSVFDDNSGIVQWDKEWAVCFKVETHNSPSALEPYGGALTGILGVNRDILGTGLSAKPIFNTDIFCFAYPHDKTLPVRPKLLPPLVIARGVRLGVQDGGNKSGIPTVNGSVFFNQSYRAKPLVFCGTGGLLKIEKEGRKQYLKHTQVGDRIVVVGGRVGKDGIHGATFSSETMHEGSPVSAVQIGDPFLQKRVIDFILAANEKNLFTGITDNGAGGLSSSVGEMAGITRGATIDLDLVPLKYPGLSDWEIVVSESQERMSVSVDPQNLDAFLELAQEYNVEASDIGNFHDEGFFQIKRGERTVGLLELEFLHDGVPKLTLEAITPGQKTAKSSFKLPDTNTDFNQSLLSLLAHPNISSRESIIRQYDHEVQGSSVIKPLMGPKLKAPCDAAVIKPLLAEKSGLVVSNGLCPQWSKYDAYQMAAMAVDEAVRNACCVGADPKSLSLLDNFCWADPIPSEKNKDGSMRLGQLVQACQGLYDSCIAFSAPLISGKDSMKNDFDDGVVKLAIEPTLLISAMGKIQDSDKSISMEFKQTGDFIYWISAGEASLSGSHYSEITGCEDNKVPRVDLKAAPKLYAKLHKAIEAELVNSAHDCSEGGAAVCLAECVIGSGLGAHIEMEGSEFALFSEGPSRLIVSVDPAKAEAFEANWKRTPGVQCVKLGRVEDSQRLKIGSSIDLSLAEMQSAWENGVRDIFEVNQ